MIKRWMIADLHLGHAKIMEYEERPFATLEEVDRTIIKNWNNTVSKYDKVFVLGDVSFYHKERLMEIVKQLNGHKILVKGNHDKKSNDYWLECGFKEVSKYPIVLPELNVIMSHEPLESVGGFFNYHGHVHSKIESYEGRKPLNYKCVSVENVGYTPMLLEERVHKTRKTLEELMEGYEGDYDYEEIAAVPIGRERFWDEV